MNGDLTIEQVLTAFAAWRRKQFEAIDPGRLLLGVMEELGELAKAHGDEARGAPPDLTADAVGDCVLYLAAYCIERGWDMGYIVRRTFDEIKDRDYKRWPLTGREELEATRR